ncbi:MAG: hypothetical protein JNM98_06020 [Rhodocyclaceae bacterium]|nr:hypothetical protein [Rhodocyclaceae bacterium]
MRQVRPGDGETEFAVRELTVAEIRQWLKGTAARNSDDALLGVLCGDFSADDLLLLTTATQEQIELLTPSECREVWNVCREVNSDFFALLDRLPAMPIPAQPSPPSSGPAAA